MELTAIKITGFNSTAIRYPGYQDCESMRPRVFKYPRASSPKSTVWSTLLQEGIVFGGEETEHGDRSACERGGELGDPGSTASG